LEAAIPFVDQAGVFATYTRCHQILKIIHGQAVAG
jgi:hypothetical protein